MNIGDWNSYFGEGVKLKGTLKFKGSLRFEGDFEGRVETGDIFIVGKTGKVAASIKAGSLHNFGQISGDVKASHKVSLHAKSRLEGDIKSPILITEESAWFQGSCVMPKLPKGKVPDTPKSLISGEEDQVVDDISPHIVAGDIGASADQEGGGKGLAYVLIFLFLSALVAGGWYFFGQGGELPISVSGVVETQEGDSKPSAERDSKASRDSFEQSNTVKPNATQENQTPETTAIPPPTSSSKTSIALAHIKNREYLKAISLLEEQIKSRPSDVLVRKSYAETLLRIGREAEAEDQFLTLARLNPTSQEAKNNKAYKKLDDGAYKGAEKAFKAVLIDNPKNHRAKLGLATALSKQGMESKAIAECKAILKAISDYSPARNRLASIYSKQNGKLQEAKELSKKSLEIFGDIPDYIDTLAEINYKMKNYDEAIKLINKAINLAPKEPYYRRQLFKFKRAKSSSS